MTSISKKKTNFFLYIIKLFVIMKITVRLIINCALLKVSCNLFSKMLHFSSKKIIFYNFLKLFELYLCLVCIRYLLKQYNLFILFNMKIKSLQKIIKAKLEDI